MILGRYITEPNGKIVNYKKAINLTQFQQFPWVAKISDFYGTQNVNSVILSPSGFVFSLSCVIKFYSLMVLRLITDLLKKLGFYSEALSLKLLKGC